MKMLLKKSVAFIALLLMTFVSFADDSKDFPDQPRPPRLVNDFAGSMTPSQQDELEQLLVQYSNTSSTQITIVTVKSLHDHDIAEYATQLGQKWGVGNKKKNNGVLVIAAMDDHKMFIATGYGIEGALPDATAFSIVNNEMKPEFKQRNYYLGFRKAADAIIQATKGEYTNENKGENNDKPGGGAGIIVLIIIIIIILAVIKGGGGRGGGRRNYMDRNGSSGMGGFLTGMILGNLLGGRGGGSDWGGGGSGGDSGGGGFGGFGGGSFGGGGAGGSW